MTKDGYRVDVAYDGNQAKTLMEAHEYDAAIFDLKMPGQDGLGTFEVGARCKSRNWRYLITAYGEVETAVEAMRRGAYDYLTKPVDLKRLRLSLERLLDHQALVAENRVLRRVWIPMAKMEMLCIEVPRWNRSAIPSRRRQ